MLTACAPLARWVDVFCDSGAFDEDELRAVLAAGVAVGLWARLHGNQLECGPYSDVRAPLEAGVTVALATDCDPGSAYVTSMPLCIALAVREMRITPAEAMFAATAGGAAALRCTDVGRLAPGASADLAVLDAPTYVHLAYRPAGRVVASVWQRGRHAFGYSESS